MIILNDERFNNEKIEIVFDISSIQNTKPNSTILFSNDFDEKFIERYKYAQKQNIEMAIKVNSIKDFIFVINLNAKYAFCKNLELAKELQTIADNYLTQTKVILEVESFDQIEKIAKAQIDGIYIKGKK